MDKDEVRRLFPTVVAFADECREVFGDGVRLVYARENGREIGKQTAVDPDRVVNLGDICIDSRQYVDAIENRKKRGR